MVMCDEDILVAVVVAREKGVLRLLSRIGSGRRISLTA